MFPTFTPLAKRQQRRQQRFAFGSQRVNDLAAIVAAVAPLQNTVLDELAQPVRQDVARNAQLRLELLEMTQAEEGTAENQKRPALADNFQCRRKAANMRSKLNLFGIHQPRR